MLDWFSEFATWMQALAPVWAYATVFLVTYAENLTPPIPGDVVVVFAGYLAGVGQLHLGVVIALSTGGSVLGFMTMYALGSILGPVVMHSDRFRWMPRKGFDRAEQWIDRYGFGVIAVNRFLSVARAVISLAAGIAQMSVWRTVSWCTVGTFVWMSLVSYAGFEVGDNWPVVVHYLSAYGRSVLVLLALVIGILLVRWYWRRQSSSPDTDAKDRLETEDDPLRG